MVFGKIILIEGTDCSGKETQSKRLVDRLNSEDIACEYMSFPRYDTPTGRIIAECYLGREVESWFGDANKVDPRIASLYYTADRVAAVPDMLNILESGKHIILDRYVESNMAHQGGKIKNMEKREEFFQSLYNLEYVILDLPLPDHTIFLYMPHLVSLELRKNRPGKADGHENKEHLKNAEEAYLQLAKMNNWKKISCAPAGTINSLKSMEDIHEEVHAYIKKKLQSDL